MSPSLSDLLYGRFWDLEVARIHAPKGFLPLKHHPEAVLVLNLKKVARWSPKVRVVIQGPGFPLLLCLPRHWWSDIAPHPTRSSPSSCTVFRQRQGTIAGARTSATRRNRSKSWLYIVPFPLIALVFPTENNLWNIFIL